MFHQSILAKPADLSGYRSLFPHTNSKLYLNHAAVSPLSTRVTAAIQSFLEQRSTGDIDVFPEFSKTLISLKEKIARLVNASVADVALITNTSEGLNIIANGIQWKRGDRIILYERDFPAVTQTFTRFIREGVVIDFIKDRNGRFDVDDIRRLIRPETQLVCLSHVQFLNGYRLPLEDIGALCHEKGILFAVDAIQSAGALQIDVRKMKIDFLSTGAQKWLMSPMGTGFVYISEETRLMLNQAYVGWLSVESPWDFWNFNQRLARDSRRFEIGTLNAMGFTGMNAALELFLEIGMHKVESQIVYLSRYLADRVQSNGFRPAMNYSDNLTSGIVSFLVSDPTLMEQELRKENIIVSARDKYLRVAPHFYNTQDDIDRLFATLKKADTKIKYTMGMSALSSLGTKK